MKLHLRVYEDAPDPRYWTVRVTVASIEAAATVLSVLNDEELQHSLAEMAGAKRFKVGFEKLETP